MSRTNINSRSTENVCKTTNVEDGARVKIKRLNASIYEDLGKRKAEHGRSKNEEQGRRNKVKKSSRDVST